MSLEFVREMKRLVPRLASWLVCAGLAAAAGLVAAEPPKPTDEIVGRLGTNRWLTPVNQIITPAGRQVPLPGLRPQMLALSPDGRLLVTSGRTAEVVVVDPVTGEIRQRVALPAEPRTNAAPDAVSGRILEPDKDGQASYTGLVFSPDGTRLYLANVEGSVKVFTVSKRGEVAGLTSFPLPPTKAPRRKAEIPAGLRVSADGRRLYVCGNLSNQLFELEAVSGQLLRWWETGVAPYDVVLAGGKAYVSNWGGCRPAADSLTGPAGQGTLVRVDPVRHIASEGSVTVINLGDRTTTCEVMAGLHASALAVSPDGRWVVVANAASDTLSVLDARTDQVVETIWARQRPSDLFGASPNALTFDKSGRRLFVCNGTQNAVAVIAFKPGASELVGLIPVGWFPAAIVHDAKRKALYAANVKALSDGRPRKSDGRPEFNSHQYGGSLSLVPVPAKRELAAFTDVALANLRYPLLQQATLPPRPGQPAISVHNTSYQRPSHWRQSHNHH
jgi:YVTN family beta-propeller protein